MSCVNNSTPTPPPPPSMEGSTSSYRTLVVRSKTKNNGGGDDDDNNQHDRTRTVSYSIIEPKLVTAIETTSSTTTETAESIPETKDNNKSAIVLFYPLGGSSVTISKMEVAEMYNCCVLSVDRPSCAGTSPLLWDDDDVEDDIAEFDKQKDHHHDDDEASYDPHELVYLKRIKGHVKDVLAVLQHEKISKIYILGVCIGHPYAVELARVCLVPSSPSSSSFPIPSVGGLTLVAPFVSTVCPYSWSVARFGASKWVPSSVLWGATEFASSAMTSLLPSVMSPKSIQKLLTTDEERQPWTSPQDFKDATQMVTTITSLSKNSKAVEARLGVAKIWQRYVCDRFAIECGCGLQLDDHSSNGSNANVSEQQSSPSQEATTVGIQPNHVCKLKIPIKIHASRTDKLASLESIEWITKRCYGGRNTADTELVIEESICSHEVMTFLGGPPRNPVLLHKIAKDWGVLRQS